LPWKERIHAKENFIDKQNGPGIEEKNYEMYGVELNTVCSGDVDYDVKSPEELESVWDVDMEKNAKISCTRNISNQQVLRKNSDIIAYYTQYWSAELKERNEEDARGNRW